MLTEETMVWPRLGLKTWLGRSQHEMKSKSWSWTTSPRKWGQKGRERGRKGGETAYFKAEEEISVKNQGGDGQRGERKIRWKRSQSETTQRTGNLVLCSSLQSWEQFLGVVGEVRLQLVVEWGLEFLFVLPGGWRRDKEGSSWWAAGARETSLFPRLCTKGAFGGRGGYH